MKYAVTLTIQGHNLTRLLNFSFYAMLTTVLNDTKLIQGCINVSILTLFLHTCILIHGEVEQNNKQTNKNKTLKLIKTDTLLGNIKAEYLLQ
jgi:hypothetical protein